MGQFPSRHPGGPEGYGPWISVSAATMVIRIPSISLMGSMARLMVYSGPYFGSRGLNSAIEPVDARKSDDVAVPRWRHRCHCDRVPTSGTTPMVDGAH